MADINKAADKLLADEDVSVTEINALIDSDVGEVSDAAEQAGDQTDYLIERFLEYAAENIDEFANAKDRIEGYWLQVEDIPGGSHYEINVQAAEYIAAHNLKNQVSVEDLKLMSQSDDWRVRLVCAWTIRDMEGDIVSQIRDQFENDPFEDDNGLFLVREGAGFSDDDDDDLF
jgi:hypothetical protein